MEKDKYVYHDELRKYRNFKIPINRVLIFFSHIFLGLLYHFQLSNKRIKVEKFKVKSFDNKRIKNIIYTPKDIELNKRCLYFIHGGGFAFNGSIHHYELAKRMAIKLKCKAIYVDYRLAPKYKFPTAIKDVYSLYKWIIDNSKNLNINKDEIILMGDSAGGNLVALTTILAKKDNYPLPKVNILLYPVLTKDLETESIKKYIDTPFCNSKDLDKYSKYYYGNIESDIPKSPYDEDLFEGYPNTYIEVAEYDCLHDDGVLFYYKLYKENINCELIEVKGAMHGYDFAINSKLIKELIEKRIKFIEKCFNKEEE